LGNQTRATWRGANHFFPVPTLTPRKTPGVGQKEKAVKLLSPKAQLN
jgi:hypothetical protein